MTVSAGELLRDELRARGWTQGQFAQMLGRPDQWVSEVVNGKKAITARSAAQIGAAFDTSAEMWLNAQTLHDVEQALADRTLRSELGTIRRRAQRATGRRWSLPAPPPDDVTVVHGGTDNDGQVARFHRDDDGNWWGPGGDVWGWSQVLGFALTVTEGEPPH